MTDLIHKKCVPCETGEGKLEPSKVQEYLKVVESWKLVGDEIKKEYKFKDFKESMKFINKVAALAEEEGHHPDLFISYNKVTVSLTTHSSNGLTENDFILAAKINNIRI